MIPRKIALVFQGNDERCSPVQLTVQPLIAPSAPPTSTRQLALAKRINTCQHQFGGHHTGKAPESRQPKESIPATRIAKTPPCRSIPSRSLNKIWVILLVAIRPISGDSEPKMATMIAEDKRCRIYPEQRKVERFFSLASAFTLW